MKREAYTPYWRTIPSEKVTAEQLVIALREFGFPHPEDKTGMLFIKFTGWWRCIAVDVLERALGIDEKLVFEAMARVDGPYRALDFWKRHHRGEEHRQAVRLNGVHADAGRKLEGVCKTLEAAQLEVLRLKAEIYDMRRETKEGA